MRARLEDGIIVNTDQRCLIKKERYPNIPTLIWPDGIDEIPSRWLRHLVVREQLSLTSVHEYANILRPFLRFCRREQRDWRTVDDEFLIQWRDKLITEKSVMNSRINNSIQRVFAFYCWAENERILKYHVGIYTEEEIGSRWADITFPLTARRIVTKYGKNEGSVSWQSTVKARRGEQRRAERHTPSHAEIRRLHEQTENDGQGARNALIFAWAEETGARRADLGRIRKLDLPKRSEFTSIRSTWNVTIERKGGKLKHLRVPKDLISWSYDYIDNERALIVAKFRREETGYSEPDELFLSSSTGLPPHLDSLTNIGRRAFRRAGILNASLHRFRGRLATDTIETLLHVTFKDKEISPNTNMAETILTMAAEKMGHSSPQSLEPYLNGLLRSRILDSDAEKAGELRTEIRLLERQEEVLRRRLGRLRQHEEETIDVRRANKAKTSKAGRRTAADPGEAEY